MKTHSSCSQTSVPWTCCCSAPLSDTVLSDLLIMQNWAWSHSPGDWSGGAMWLHWSHSLQTLPVNLSVCVWVTLSSALLLIILQALLPLPPLPSPAPPTPHPPTSFCLFIAFNLSDRHFCQELGSHDCRLLGSKLWVSRVEDIVSVTSSHITGFSWAAEETSRSHMSPFMEMSEITKTLELWFFLFSCEFSKD